MNTLHPSAGRFAAASPALPRWWLASRGQAPRWAWAEHAPRERTARPTQVVGPDRKEEILRSLRL